MTPLRPFIVDGYVRDSFRTSFGGHPLMTGLLKSTLGRLFKDVAGSGVSS